MIFEETLKRIAPKLRGIVYNINYRSNSLNQEDLFQEAVIHLWQDFKEGKLADKTDSYILQGCFFHLKNYIRKDAVKVSLISLDALRTDVNTSLEDVFPAQDCCDYLKYLDSKLLVEKMKNNGLTIKEKEVLSFCLAGLTTREIGRRMGVSHVMIIKLKNRIKERYEKFFQELN
jgi:RNA polymerase sigma factor (sigma-70 family)